MNTPNPTSATTTTNAERHGIVVGVDGSDAARHALVWAMTEAEQHATELDLITAWSFPYQWAEGFNARWAEDGEYFARAATADAEKTIDEVLAGKPRPPWLKVHAVEGPAAQVLIERARTAELLVVGTRGRGGFADLLLGSVSTACVHHATCPTAVIPPT